MPKKHREPKFSGPLAEPTYPPKLFRLAEASDQKSFEEQVLACLSEKLGLLLDYYQLDRADPDLWFRLSLRLAMDFVPGMRIVVAPPASPGRKRTWQAGLGAALLRAVDETMRERSLDIKAAIAHLKKSDPTWRQYTQQNLAARLREEKRRNRLAKMQIDEWISGGSLASVLLGEAAGISQPPTFDYARALFGEAKSGSKPPVRETDGNSNT